ncbi:unannotated protein [freshwater metagenome]|uniref:Unannotated protein n=1 Tax=freshwater metagenome TaxID=449393 RepID=A0A6J7C049_9ZZZZ
MAAARDDGLHAGAHKVGDDPSGGVLDDRARRHTQHDVVARGAAAVTALARSAIACPAVRTVVVLKE